MVPNPSYTSLGTGIVFILVFSLAFMAGGGFALYSSVDLISFWYRAQSWPEVPAQIQSVELLSKTSSENDSVTYKASAKYTYQFNEQQYEGNRVTIGNAYTSFQDYPRHCVSVLNRHVLSEESFPCYVNPKNPNESVLFRDFPSGNLFIRLLVGSIFFTIGLIFFIGIFYAIHQTKITKKLQEQYPNQPWVWKPEWAEGVIRSNEKSKFFLSLFFAGIWNAISLPLWFLFFYRLTKGLEAHLLLFLIHPAVGIGLAIWAVRRFLLWRKYGVSKLQLITKPAVLGEKFGGIIHSGINIDPDDGFHVTLKNVHIYKTRSGKKTRTHRNVLWENSQKVEKEMLEEDHTRSAIPVYFELPSDAQPTDETNNRNKYIWQIECKASVPGIDYETEFEIPIIGQTVEIK